MLAGLQVSASLQPEKRDQRRRRASQNPYGSELPDGPVWNILSCRESGWDGLPLPPLDRPFPCKAVESVTAAIEPKSRVEKRMSRSSVSKPPAGSPGKDLLCRLTGNTVILLARFFSGYTVRWVDCQPETCQRVYFANHSSHLDAVVLWSALPTEIRNLTRPVAAKDYWAKTAWRRLLAKSFNAMLIDRKEIKVHQSPVDLMIREIGDLYSLIVFPEGGRADDGEMAEFKSGIYYLAKKRPDLELVPVYMENLNRILPRGEYMPVPLLSSITIGHPIWLESGEPKADFLVRAREAVLKLKNDRES